MTADVLTTTGPAGTVWGHHSLGGWSLDATGAVERLVADPSAKAIRQALPFRLTSAIATSQRLSDDKSRSKRLLDACASLGLLGLATVRPGRRIASDSSSSLVNHVASELDVPSARGIILFGPPRANQKPVIQLHDRFGRTIAYVKVGWNTLTHELLAEEERSLRYLATLDVRGFNVPAVMARGELGGSTWLAVAPLSVRARQRPSLPGIDAVARAIEATSTHWSGGVRESPFLQRLEPVARRIPAGQTALDSALDRWGDVPVELAGGHGDFVPWNMLTGKSAVALWDWERYRKAVPVGFDRLHYRTQVGIRRGRRPLPEVLLSIKDDLATVLPDLSPPTRCAHFDWYLVEMLCRYESDMAHDPGGGHARLVRGLLDVVTNP